MEVNSVDIGDLHVNNGGNQMKCKLIKRIGAFMLVCVMALGISVPALAAQPANAMTIENSEENSSPEATLVASYTFDTDDMAITPRTNNTVGGLLSASGSATLYPNLDSYIGLTKAFHATTSSDSSSGAVLLYLYNKNGKLVSSDWIIGVNDYAYWTLTLPSSGTYTLQVYVQGSTAPVYFYAWWES